MKNRALARELALKLLYAHELGGAGATAEVLEQSESTVVLNESDEKFMRGLVDGVLAQQETLDAVIAEHAVGWSLARLAKVDLLILRIAVYELRHRPKIPAGATINEAVELAKRFGEEKSYSFVNGVLGTVARQGANA